MFYFKYPTSNQPIQVAHFNFPNVIPSSTIEYIGDMAIISFHAKNIDMNWKKRKRII